MEHLTVDDTMRERVLEHIAAAKLEPVSRKHVASPWRWSAVACVALLVLGGVMVRRAESPQPPQLATDRPGHMTVVSPITTVDTVEALADLVGFPMDALVDLPFEPETVTYTVIQGTMAQSSYQRGEQTAILRKARGTVDPSGDYSSYEQVISLELEGVTGELRGNENHFTVAWWTDGTYAWSLSLSEPTAQSTWETLIETLLDNAAE